MLASKTHIVLKIAVGKYPVLIRFRPPWYFAIGFRIDYTAGTSHRGSCIHNQDSEAFLPPDRHQI